MASGIQPTTGREALEIVGKDKGAWNWVFLAADPEDLPLVGGGNGSVEEMRECLLKHDQMLFGLARLGFGSGRMRRTKWVFIQGSHYESTKKRSSVHLGMVLGLRPRMERIIGEYANVSASIEITTIEDFNPKFVIERVSKKIVVDESDGVPVFSVDKFWEALIEDTGGQFPLFFKSGAHASEAHGFSVTDQESPPPADATVPSSTVDAATKTDEAPRQDVPPPAADEKKADTESSEGEMEELVGSDEEGEKVVQETDKIAQESLVKESKKTVVETESLQKESKNVTSQAHPQDPVFQTLEEFTDLSDTPKPTGIVDAEELSKRPARSPAKEPTTPSSMLAQRADPPPLALEGFMLKKSSGWLTEMQLRFFEVKGGWLRYWWTKREKDEGTAPRREFKLIGLKIERKQGSPKFKLHLPGESQPYSLNADVGSHVLENPSLSGQVHRKDEWVRTLTAHSAYASSARKSRSTTK
eukprot:CAMPEP_0194554122 /NCGR_PEP_ID=MMETSP0253-20130528/97576_1 /TAXON_ID=2966 /ORGANISM="Noctiluca scintillans" /LENGTH=471 /DNA_ID=CAMNT_0039401605 /DNA_START=9 /DNA_END=1424 /DNA_ORIENTATION=-